MRALIVAECVALAITLGVLVQQGLFIQLAASAPVVGIFYWIVVRSWG